MTLEELQEWIGFTLPADYQDFLSSPSPLQLEVTHWYPISEPTPFGEHGGIDTLYNLEHFADTGINGFADVAMLIIGGSVFGYPTCMCLAPNRFGHMYYYDFQQRSLWPDSQFHSMFKGLSGSILQYLVMRKARTLHKKEEGFESFYRAADSFTEFLSLLKPETID